MRQEGTVWASLDGTTTKKIPDPSADYVVEEAREAVAELIEEKVSESY